MNKIIYMEVYIFIWLYLIIINGVNKRRKHKKIQRANRFKCEQ